MQPIHFSRAMLALVVAAGTSLAGPPLICHTFSIGRDTSLPWGADADWNSPNPNYDTRNLASDTLKLLDSGKPLLTRMETLRRAAIYSSKDAVAWLELANRLMARALTSETRGESNSQALFDAGYFIESMKQMAGITKASFVSGIDGYDWAKRSLPGIQEKPVAEFAIGLMGRPWPNEHIRRAVADAQDGSLLAVNLLKFFPKQTLVEVKRNMGASTDSH
jgi:hypothetical protein